MLTNYSNFFMLDFTCDTVSVLPPEVIGADNQYAAVIRVTRIGIRSVGAPKVVS
jgi:hypothetical protein